MLGPQTNPELEFMTPAEFTLFERMRKQGELTFFRIGLCELCRAEIPKSKRYCSETCYHFCKEDEMLGWSWRIDLTNLMGKRVKIETKDGVYLSGKLTGLDTTEFLLDERTVKTPVAFRLDDDPEKVVDAARIIRVDLEP